MNAGSPLLELRNLHVDYLTGKATVSAVQDVTLSIVRGASLGLVGESGSGKSTIAAALLRLLPTNARISPESMFFAGEDLSALSEQELNQKWRWRQMAMVFQRSLSALSPVHRLGDQLNDVLAQNEPRLNVQQRKERIDSLLQAVHLTSRVLSSYPFELSGGMMQRAMIALGLLCNPPFLIFDEATTALDVITQAQILQEVNRLKGEFNLTALIISHDVGVINETADQIAVLYAGQLMEVGERDRFFSQPAHPYSRALVSSVPKLSGTTGRIQGIPGSLPSLTNPPRGCRFAPRCREVRPECHATVPPLRDLGKGQLVRCVLYPDAPVVAS